jgi:hypothetical protein
MKPSEKEVMDEVSALVENGDVVRRAMVDFPG